MEDYRHLRGKEGEGEEKSLIKDPKKVTTPEEAHDLLIRMKHISNLIRDVSLTIL